MTNYTFVNYKNTKFLIPKETNYKKSSHKMKKFKKMRRP